jgi:hypothetical protein
VQLDPVGFVWLKAQSSISKDPQLEAANQLKHHVDFPVTICSPNSS